MGGPPLETPLRHTETDSVSHETALAAPLAGVVGQHDRLLSISATQRRIRQLRESRRGVKRRYSSENPQFWKEYYAKGGVDPRDVVPEEFWDALDGSGSSTPTVEIRELWKAIQSNEARRPAIVTLGPATRMVMASEIARELGISERRAIEFANSLGVNAIDISGKYYIMVSDLEYGVWCNSRPPDTKPSDLTYKKFLQWATATGGVYAGLRRIATERRLKEACSTDRPGKLTRRGRRRVRVAEHVAGLPVAPLGGEDREVIG